MDWAKLDGVEAVRELATECLRTEKGAEVGGDGGEVDNVKAGGEMLRNGEDNLGGAGIEGRCVTVSGHDLDVAHNKF